MWLRQTVTRLAVESARDHDQDKRFQAKQLAQNKPNEKPKATSRTPARRRI
jgi:hypothetical protein